MNEPQQSFTALVLAGRRGSRDVLADALAAADASGHHALLDVAGVPMLLRVIRTLRMAPCIGGIVVSIDDPGALDRVPELKAAVSDGSIRCRAALDSPSRSVLDALTALGAEEKVLVVTADHALLTPEMLECFTAEASASTDVLVGLVSAATIRAKYPQTRRTYLKLRDGWYSGANLFAFLTPEARRAADFWQRAEQFRKQPWRLVRSFGLVSLLLFLTRRLDLDAALARASFVIGARIRAVRMPFAEAAIDVDRPADLALVNTILEARTHPESQPHAR